MKSSTSLRKRCGRACRNFRRFLGIVSPITVIAGNAPINFLVRIGNGAVTLARDGIEIVMNVIDGIEGFANAIAEGNINKAFEELGKGFTNAFLVAQERVKSIGEGIWKGLTAIGDAVIKFGKLILTIKPSTWAFLVCSIVLGVALSLIFPPLAVALLGVQAGTWTATAVVLTVELSLGLIQTFLIDPHLEKALVNRIDGPAEEQTEERPDTITSEDGLVITLDKERNEYCYTKDNYRCYNETLEKYCIIQNDFPDICPDETDRLYVVQDGVTSYLDKSSQEWSPPLNKIKIDGVDYMYNKGREEYCYLDEEKQTYCWSSQLETECLVVPDSLDRCFDDKGWFIIQDEVKYYYFESLKEPWVAEQDLP